MNEKNPPKKGRILKSEVGTTVGIYLKPETYKMIKEKAEKKYTSISVIIRQVIGKMIEVKEKV